MRLPAMMFVALWGFPVLADESRVPLPQLVLGKGERCVEPTAVIRRSHMEFLLHQRERTVHFGIRTRRHSLVGCIECHSVPDKQGSYMPVNAPDQFCESCHRYAAVELDCFECHAATPQ